MKKSREITLVLIGNLEQQGVDGTDATSLDVDDTFMLGLTS